MKRLINAESYLSILLAISLFGFLYLGYTQWQSQQNRQFNFLFQQRQALQIAENQLALKMAEAPTLPSQTPIACEDLVEQNGIVFEVVCNANQIIVSFPLGQIKLVKP